jgi:dUTP pyrophosphatase
MSIIVDIEKLPHAFALPAYHSTGAAGADLCAAIDKTIILKPLQRCLVPTGLKIALPEGYEAQIRPRSGLALKNGVMIPNSPGTIDSDYRGEIKIILINMGDEDFVIQNGMRIAQMVIVPAPQAIFNLVDAISTETVRGEGGFGSTGLVDMIKFS